MYPTVLWLHSYWRWVVLLAGANALARATLGGTRGWPWTRRAQHLHTLFVASLDLQLLLGLILYVYASPSTQAAFADLDQVMKNPHYRFWTVEHGPVQLLAVVVAHIGKHRVKRAASDHQRHRRCSIFTGIAIVLILAAIPWPGLDVARPLFR
jgi:hypothetical protein